MFQTHLCHTARFLSLSLSSTFLLLPYLVLHPLCLCFRFAIEICFHSLSLHLFLVPLRHIFFLSLRVPFPFRSPSPPVSYIVLPTCYLNATVPILVPFYPLEHAISPSSSSIRGRVSSPPRGR